MKNGFSQADIDRLETIFLSMSKEQRDQHAVTFITTPPLPKNIPTPEEFEGLKDPKKYGVWLDGKKIENGELNNYINTDFSSFGASPLMKNAYDYGKYIFHANLMTHTYYDSHLKETLARKHLTLMIKK